jgi:hypothetical protein
MGVVRSIAFEKMKRNALILAETAKILKLPVVLTFSMAEYAQGPLLSELSTILPNEFTARVKRFGIVNAMNGENLLLLSQRLTAKKLILAGVTNDVCTVYPALSLIEAGYDVQVP